MKMRKNAGNIMKRSAALFLALVMVCAMFPGEVFADLAWYYDESGNLFAVDEPAAITEQSQWYVGADGLLYRTEETVSVVQEEQPALSQEVPAEEPAQAEEPFTYISGTAEDSAVFTAYGRFPEGAEMHVTQCDFGGGLMKKVFPAERAEKITEYKAYDVSFMLNGEPYDPEMVPQFTVLPNMQNPLNTLGVAAYSSYVSTVPENENGIVLSSEQVEELTAAGEEDSIHYVSETFYNLFDIEAEQQGDSRLVFWSDLYTPVVIYREGFDFEPVPWVLQSDQSVTLSHILETADLGLGLSDIAEQGIIYLGDPELVKMRVHEFDGDWEITSAQGFTAAQVLKVLFKNGGVLNIELYCEGNEPAPVAETEKETWNDWVEMFRDVELSGSWPRDVVTIAKTQLGYTADEDGYTRYGVWYGDEYGDWCAMFCSFCMAFAGVDSAVVPYEQDCARWIEQMKVKELYHDAASGYTPKAGDLIFFSSNGVEADHVGIVYDNEPGQIVTIEGGNTVEHRFYLHDDARILGYGEMPAATARVELAEKTIESTPAEDGAVAVISGKLPINAEPMINAVQLSENEVAAYLGTDIASAITEYIVYDIKILVDGQEWQPDESVSVTVRKPASNDMSIGQMAVEHIDSITGEAERIQTSAIDDEAISFITDGFSLYVFYTFTVDYYFEGAEYHQAGLSSMYLSDLLTALGIEHSVSEIESVTFSNSNLLSVSKDASDDWLLCSLEAFSSDEILTLTLKDGEEIRIDTKDVAYTWFNVHNVVIGGNAGDKYYFTFDYFDENGVHQQYDRWLANYEEINALKVALNTPVTITQIQGKYMDAGGTIHTDGVYDNYLQLGGDPHERTNVFHVDNMTTVFQNVNVCFYEISSNGLGILNITKKAVNSSNPNQTYHFVVLYHAMNYKMDAMEFDLKADETQTILYYCDTQYGNNMEIFIAETSSFFNCDTSFTVNGGSSMIPKTEELYGRLNQDINEKYGAQKWQEYNSYKYIKIPISGNYDTFNVVCNNTFVDRSVTIRKTAVQGEPNKSYTFTLNAYNASNQLVWQGSASVKSGNSSKVTIPVDCSYVIVQETNHAGYTVSMSGSGSNSGTDGRRIPKAQFPADVTFTNTREVVPITLTKKLDCDDMAGAGPFNFEVTVTDASGNPIDVSTITQATGTGVTLKSGTSNVLQVSIGGFSSSVDEKSVQINVPKGAKITITEINPGPEYTVENTNGSNGTAIINNAASGSSVTFTNTKAPSTVSMTVIKRLDGLQNGKFEFEMSVDSSSWPPSAFPADWPSEAVIDTNGIIRFTLTVSSGNEPQITIPGLPVGATVTITETSHDGFIVKFTDDASAYKHIGYTDEYELTENKTVTVVNKAGTVLPKTGGEGVSRYYATGALLMASACIYAISLKRKRERRAA